MRLTTNTTIQPLDPLQRFSLNVFQKVLMHRCSFSPYIITPQSPNLTKIRTNLAPHPQQASTENFLQTCTITELRTCIIMVVVGMCCDMHIHSCARPQEDIVLAGTHPTKNLTRANQISRVC